MTHICVHCSSSMDEVCKDFICCLKNGQHVVVPKVDSKLCGKCGEESFPAYSSRQIEQAILAAYPHYYVGEVASEAPSVQVLGCPFCNSTTTPPNDHCLMHIVVHEADCFVGSLSYRGQTMLCDEHLARWNSRSTVTPRALE